jgi:adenylate cyclase class 2
VGVPGSIETEIKLRIADVAATRAALRRAGAELVGKRHFEDNVLFDDPAGTLRAAGTVLRLRTIPHRAVLTFKGPRELEEGVKSREERETVVADPAALRVILERLGFRPVFRYQKHRETWRLRGQTVEVDETPVGPFLEIEGDAEGIHAAAADLGYSRSDYMLESYVSLFFAAGGQGDMVFPE